MSGLVLAGKFVVGERVAAETLERVGFALIGQDLRPGDGARIVLTPRGAGHLVAKSDDTAGIDEGQRAQEHAIDHGKNSCGGADAEGQHENGSGRKARRPAQLAQNQV